MLETTWPFRLLQLLCTIIVGLASVGCEAVLKASAELLEA